MRTQIRPLTGIRGVAALWVVILHLTLLGHDSVTGPLGNLVAHGYLAVDLFFILSGFVMGLSYNDLFATGCSWRRYGIFLIRRAARVYPLYLVVTVLIVALSASGVSRDVSMHGIGSRLLCNLALVQSWGLSESIDGPAWSISTEFASYLLFPLIFGAVIRQSWLATCAAAAVCCCAVVCVSMVSSPWVGPGRWGPLDVHWAYSSWPLVRCLAEFSIGLAIYRAAMVPFVRRLADNRSVGYAVIIATVALLILPRTDLLVIGLFAMLVLVLVQGRGVAAAFGSPVMVFLGDISYSIYLLHWELVRLRRLADALLAPHLGPAVAGACSVAVFFVVLLMCSWLAYRFIEKPGRRVLRLAERLITRGGTGGPATLPDSASATSM